MPPKLRFLWSLVLLCLLAPRPQAQVVINEIMAGGSERLLRWNATGVPTLGFGPSWYAANFTDQNWQTGAAPFGFGTFSNVSPPPVLGTNVATQMMNLTPTLYLRKVFNVSPDQASSTDPLTFAVGYNDGFVCYLNGVEVARRNAGPTNGFNYHDQVAAGSTPANTESAAVPFIRSETITLNSAANRLLVAGVNTLSVQVLNYLETSVALKSVGSGSSASKSFIGVENKNNFFFQGELVIAGAAPVTLVSRADTWRYFPGVTEPSGGLYDPALLFSGKLSVPWGSAGFDDSSWNSGATPLIAGSAPAGVTGGTNVTSQVIGKSTSLYARIVFNVIPNDLTETLPLQLLLDWDDSFVAYINGVEIVRDRLGLPNTFTPNTAVAESSRNGGTFSTYTLEVPAKLLKQGPNVFAVQVHNVQINDPDLFFRAQLKTNTGGSNRTLISPTSTWRYFVGTAEPGTGGDSQETQTSAEDSPEGPDASLDWVELYNTGAEPVDLSGWGLSDDGTNPLRWKFPAGTQIPPGGYLLVACDGLNITTPPTGGLLHTDFKLREAGESISLVDATGKTQQAILFGKQTAFQSYGRGVDGTYKYLDPPTPGTLNSVTSLAGQVAAPTFSQFPGFYNAGLSVLLSSATADATFRYTLDGTEPTETNGFSGKVVSVSASRPLRVRAYKAGMLPSEIVTGTYLIGEPATRKTIPALCVTGDEQRSIYQPFGAMAIKGGAFTAFSSPYPTYENDKWTQTGATPDSGVDLGAYNNPLQHGRYVERPGTLELLQNGGSPIFNVGFGMRVAGSAHARPRYRLSQQNRAPGQSPNSGAWSATDYTQKPSFNFYFRGDYGADLLDAQIFPNYPVHQFGDLRIRAGKNDTYNPFVEDEFMRRLFINTGQVGSRGLIANLYINGVYKGFYNPCEHVREDFLRLHHGRQNSWDILQVMTISAGDALTFREIINYVRANPQSNLVNYRGMQSRLDMVNFIDYLIVNLLGNTGDWPYNNYIAARERVAGGLYRYYMWDAEGAFGDFGGNVRVNMFTPDTTGSIVTTNPGGADLSESIRILYTLLAASPEFKQLFADRLQKHFFNDGCLTEGKLMAEWNPLKSTMIGLGVSGFYDKVTEWVYGVGDPKRYTVSGATNLPSRRNVLFNGYTDDTGASPVFIPGQLIAAGLWPTTLAPQLSSYGGTIAPGGTVTISNPNAGGTILYTTNGLDPRAEGGGSQGQAYSGSIAIYYPTTLRARVLQNGQWSPLIEASFNPGTVEPLLITEIMYHPAGNGTSSGDDYEFLEIKNAGSQTVVLSGMSIANGISYFFPAGSSIAPGEFRVIARSAARFSERYAGISVSGEYGVSQSLQNSGETIELRNSLGSTIFSVAYGDSAPWPVAADGGGFSLVPVASNSNTQPSDPNSWRGSSFSGGSPGMDDPAPSTFTIYINELLANAGPGEADQVELFNPNSNPVDISYWWLSDDPLFPKKYQLPVGSVIAAQGFLVLKEGMFNIGSSPFAFSANGEVAVLSSGDSNGSLTGNTKVVRFGASEVGVSFGRYINSQGFEFFTPQRTPSFGLENAGPRIGPVVISEIMYKPGASGVTSEYLELCNISAAAVPLYDPANPANSWSIDGVAFTFPTRVTLAPGQIALVVKSDPVAFRSSYSIPETIAVFGPFTGSLDNSGESIVLQKPGQPYRDEQGTAIVPMIEVDRVEYSPLSPWPTAAASQGCSIERLNLHAFGNDAANWRASASSTGTPGVLTALPFAEWRRQFFTQEECADAAIGGAMADPDHDGLSNLREWAHGLDPLRANSDPVAFGIVQAEGKSYLSLQVRRNRSAIALTLEMDVASSLPAWTTGSGVIVGAPVSNGDGSETITLRDSVPIEGASSRFLRLRVSAP